MRIQNTWYHKLVDILYQIEGGRTRVECRFEDETIWLTQALIRSSERRFYLKVLDIYATRVDFIVIDEKGLS